MKDAPWLRHFMSLCTQNDLTGLEKRILLQKQLVVVCVLYKVQIEFRVSSQYKDCSQRRCALRSGPKLGSQSYQYLEYIWSIHM